jgi:multidrug transporter EmrE-like cation transporter
MGVILSGGVPYIIGCIFFTVYGQIVMKWQIVQYGELPTETMSKIVFLLKLLLDPYVFFGLFAAFLAAICWMAAMTKYDVSQAYPYVSAGLTLFTMLGGVFILSEPLTYVKIGAVALICSGIVLMSYSS